MRLLLLLVYVVLSHEQWRWTEGAAWVKQRAPDAYVSRVLHLKESPLGLVPTATRPIKNGDLLLQVPQAAIFSSEECFPSELPLSHTTPLGNFSRTQVLSEHTKLAMCLTVHRALGTKSPYWGWIQTLPQQVSNIYHLNATDYGVFRGTELFSRFTQDEKVIENAIELLFPVFEEFVRDYHVDIGELNRDTFSKLFRQAGSLAQSRSFNLTSQQLVGPSARPVYLPSLVPLVEMFNHGPLGQLNCRFRWRHRKMEVLATRDIEAGEELLLSYGLRSNSQLAVSYGFVLANNTENFVLVPELGKGALEFNFQQRLGGGRDMCERLFFQPAEPTGWSTKALKALCPSHTAAPLCPLHEASPCPLDDNEAYASLKADFQLRRQIMLLNDPSPLAFLFPDILVDSTAQRLRLAVVSRLSSFMVHRILSSPHNQLQPFEEQQVLKTLLVFCIDELSIRLHSLGVPVSRAGGMSDVSSRLLLEAQTIISKPGDNLTRELANSELRLLVTFCSTVKDAN